MPLEFYIVITLSILVTLGSFVFSLRLKVKELEKESQKAWRLLEEERKKELTQLDVEFWLIEADCVKDVVTDMLANIKFRKKERRFGAAIGAKPLPENFISDGLVGESVNDVRWVGRGKLKGVEYERGKSFYDLSIRGEKLRAGGSNYTAFENAVYEAHKEKFSS